MIFSNKLGLRPKLLPATHQAKRAASANILQHLFGYKNCIRICERKRRAGKCFAAYWAGLQKRWHSMNLLKTKPTAKQSTRNEIANAPTNARDDAGPRSLIRTLRIIEHISAAPEGATLARMSVELDAPKSSLLGLLRPLCGYGYIVNTDGRYLLGPASYRLGVSIMPTLSIARIALPIMRELVDQCGETVLIATLDRGAGRATYVEKIESSRSIRYTVPLGTARSLYCSAAGRILLAYADQEYIDHYLSTENFVALTPQTLTRAADLRKLLPTIREQGLSVTMGEVSSDVAGFAAPIFDHQGAVVATLAMAAPVSRARSPQLEIAERIKAAAESISFGFGHLGAALKTRLTSDSAAPAARPLKTTEKRVSPKAAAGVYKKT
jgi:IclR family acetate operon transcriptional repressor